ncbi:MAG: hypothetical protein DCO96_11410 [Fluviicola sp. XM-24bin1]|nr:MAG: hypothetical protein DCO96_11410 [Fluviicola sp. XM-24bin1]
MEAANTIFNIESILFESNDPEVLMRGTMVKGVMQYESELILSHTQLNKVINLLQRQNAETTIHDLISSEPMYNGALLYSGTFAGLSNPNISLDSISADVPMRQIRA